MGAPTTAKGRQDRQRRARALRRAAILAAALASIARGGARAQTCPDHLFVVARSKNANIVAYDVNRGPGGDLVSSEPVIAYWLLDGDPNRREELTRMQRERAYGVSGEPGDSPGTFDVVFNAQKKRRLIIRTVDGCPVAMTPIAGRNAILRRLFVQSKEGTVMPKVEYVEFFGEDPDTRKPVHEKSVPQN